MTDQPQAVPVSGWAPMRRKVFRALWLAQLGSNVGSWMQSVGAQWFLLQSTHSSTLVAWVQTAALLPVLLLSLVAGVIADLADRRRVLLVMSAAAAVAAAVLTIIAASSLLAAWSLLLMTFVLGCVSALTGPAWQAIQPDLVPRQEIPAAASLSSVTVNGARAIGPAIAGVLVSVGGPSLVFGLNAVSFIGVFGALLWWRPPVRAPRREPIVAAMSAGLRYVRAAPGVRRILLRSGLFVVPACALWALLPNVASTDLLLGSAGYGLLLGVLGAGAILGVFVMPVLRRKLSSSWLLAGSAAAYAVGLVAPASGSLVLVVPAFVLTGLAWIVTLTQLNATLQLTLAGWVRARGMAIYLIVFLGGQGVASFAWGLVATQIGVLGCFLAAAVLLVLVAASVPLLPLPPQAGTLDRTITAPATAAPTLVFTPDPTDGPVVISISYRVDETREAAFLAAVRQLEKSRRRTGASEWRLDRSADEKGVFREEFTERSWGEYSRSETERWTGYDREVLATVAAQSDETPQVEHYFVVG